MNSKQKNRKSFRLKDYDYSQNGFYFITICTQNNKCLFGKVQNDEMVLSKYGKIVKEEWEKTEEIRSNAYHLTNFKFRCHTANKICLNL